MPWTADGTFLSRASSFTSFSRRVVRKLHAHRERHLGVLHQRQLDLVVLRPLAAGVDDAQHLLVDGLVGRAERTSPSVMRGLRMTATADQLVGVADEDAARLLVAQRRQLDLLGDAHLHDALGEAELLGLLDGRGVLRLPLRRLLGHDVLELLDDLLGGGTGLGRERPGARRGARARPASAARPRGSRRCAPRSHRRVSIRAPAGAAGCAELRMMSSWRRIAELVLGDDLRDLRAAARGHLGHRLVGRGGVEDEHLGVDVLGRAAARGTSPARGRRRPRHAGRRRGCDPAGRRPLFVAVSRTPASAIEREHEERAEHVRGRQRHQGLGGHHPQRRGGAAGSTCLRMWAAGTPR